MLCVFFPGSFAKLRKECVCKEKPKIQISLFQQRVVTRNQWSRNVIYHVDLVFRCHQKKRSNAPIQLVVKKMSHSRPGLDIDSLSE